MSKTPFPVVAVQATDWSYYDSERTIHEAQECNLIDGWTVGLLVKETDEALVIAHQFFMAEKTVRHTSVISKITIKQRLDFGTQLQRRRHLIQSPTAEVGLGKA